MPDLHRFTGRPWMEPRKAKPITDIWLAQQLRPYGITSRSIRLADLNAKGYLLDDFADAFRRYIPRSELDAPRESPKTDPPPA